MSSSKLSSSSLAMSSSDNPPTLTLSDIMHHMSPSPVLDDENADEELTERATSPEPLTEADAISMRKRVEEMGLAKTRTRHLRDMHDMEPSADPFMNISSRERELADMVLRLTDPMPVDPAQLERQADAIANLTIQRNYIVRQAEEERERWSAERESFDRMVEALLTTQRPQLNLPEDIDRIRSKYESEIRALQDRLHDSYRKQTSLENELLRLKPLLLMQPPKGKEKEKDKEKEKGKAKDFRPLTTTDGQNKPHYPFAFAYSNKVTMQVSSNTPEEEECHPHIPRPRRRLKDMPILKLPNKRYNATTSFSSDAFTDHMLLAAKRIGRKRAAQVAGIAQHAEHEREALIRDQETIRVARGQEKFEQERQERMAADMAAGFASATYYRTPTDASTPTPQQPTLKAGPSHSPRTPRRSRSDLVFVNMLATPNGSTGTWNGRRNPGTPLRPPATIKGSAQKNVASTSSASTTTTTPTARKTHLHPSNPPTPLDSLLDAARMMDDNDADNARPKSKMNGKGRLMEDPESPLPKRRKVLSAGRLSAKVVAPAGGRSDHVKSALDVLADQAVVADQNDRRASTSTSGGTRKGKEKVLPGTQPPEAADPNDEGVDLDPQGSGSVAQAVSSSKGGGKSKRFLSSTRSTTSTPVAFTPPSTSSRPVRQASRKRVDPMNAETATRSSTRVRGRPRGRPSKLRQEESSHEAGPSSRVIAAPIPRVIAHPPGYSPLDEAIAKSPRMQAKEKELERQRSESQRPHTPTTTAHVQPPINFTPTLGLRPVVVWGEHGRIPDDSNNSPVRNGQDHDREGQENIRVDDHPTSHRFDDDEAELPSLIRPLQIISAAEEPSQPIQTPNLERQLRAPPSFEDAVMAEPDETSPFALYNDDARVARSNSPRNTAAEMLPSPMAVDKGVENVDNGIDGGARDNQGPEGPAPHQEPEELAEEPQAIVVVGAEPDQEEPVRAAVEEDAEEADLEADADADAEIDEDEDADGEKEEEEEDPEPEPTSRNNPFRSKSPPPDPPPPGPDNGNSAPDADDEQDDDADAEGEIEFEEGEGPASFSPSSCYQACIENLTTFAGRSGLEAKVFPHDSSWILTLSSFSDGKAITSCHGPFLFSPFKPRFSTSFALRACLMIKRIHNIFEQHELRSFFELLDNLSLLLDLMPRTASRNRHVNEAQVAMLHEPPSKAKNDEDTRVTPPFCEN